MEFFLIDSAAHLGECYPHASGLRFHHDLSRPRFDVVTAIELGDLDRGCHTSDISAAAPRLYRLPACTPSELPVIPVDERAAEVRAINLD